MFSQMSRLMGCFRRGGAGRQTAGSSAEMLRCSNAILSLQHAIRQRVAERHRYYEDRTRKDRRAGRGNVEETAASANQKTNQKADKNFHFSFTPFRFDPEHSESTAPTAIPPTRSGRAMDHPSIRAPTAVRAGAFDREPGSARNRESQQHVVTGPIGGKDSSFAPASENQML